MQKKKFQHLGRVSPGTEPGSLSVKLMGNIPHTAVLRCPW